MISEIFSSLQGEGLHCGKKQIFIRFSGCNLRCWYCDTKYAWDVDKAKTMSVDEIISEVETLADRDNVSSICITGGEALLQVSVLSTLLPLLKRKFEVHLETNGTFVNECSSIFKYIDVVSFSFKFPSDCGKIFWNEYEFIIKEFKKQSFFVKSVITHRTKEEEVKRLIKILKNKKIPLVFQPVSLDSIVSKKIVEFINLASKDIQFLYLLPQMQKIWGIK